VNLAGFLEKLKPLKINKDKISLAPFTLGFFKYWGKDFKIEGKEFEVQCKKDLNKNWKKYVTKAKIPDCLLDRGVCRELLNIDCTWVPKNSGPYYKNPASDNQVFPLEYPFNSYIYLAVEHAEDDDINMRDSNMGSPMTAIRKLGYIKSLFKIVIYKPFKNEWNKNDQTIKTQLDMIQKEIKRIELHQEKGKADNWLIIMLFNYFKRSSIVIGKNDLLLRGYALDNIGEIISKDEDSKNYHEYKITGFYA
jgi:hypothetical protein